MNGPTGSAVPCEARVVRVALGLGNLRPDIETEHTEEFLKQCGYDGAKCSVRTSLARSLQGDASALVDFVDMPTTMSFLKHIRGGKQAQI